MPGRVSRRVQGFEFDLTHAQPFAVRKRARPATRFGRGTREQFQRRSGFELGDAGQVVVVLVRIRCIGDAQPLFACVVIVLINVPAHIEHQRLSSLLGTEEIGRMPEAWFMELLVNHPFSSFGVRRVPGSRIVNGNQSACCNTGEFCLFYQLPALTFSNANGNNFYRAGISALSPRPGRRHELPHILPHANRLADGDGIPWVVRRTNARPVTVLLS